jgi:hypothetical protein
MSLLGDVEVIVEDALNLVDDLGIYKSKVYFLTRKWSGEEVGDGDAKDSIEILRPTPQIKALRNQYKRDEGGTHKEGDIYLQYLPKKTFPEESLINCSSEQENVEKFYYIDGGLYNVVSVNRDYVSWNVLVRKTKKQRVFL